MRANACSFWLTHLRAHERLDMTIYKMNSPYTVISGMCKVIIFPNQTIPTIVVYDVYLSALLRLRHTTELSSEVFSAGGLCCSSSEEAFLDSGGGSCCV